MKAKRTGDVAQGVEGISSQFEALNSNPPVLTNKNEKKQHKCQIKNKSGFINV
jgi:hypothetical protein